MQYTIGDWTVSSLTTDTVTTTKNITVPDLDYKADYSISKDSPEEAILINTTGASLTSPESIRYANTKISNVYVGSEIPTIQQHPIKGGVRTLCELRTTLSATNSVSGLEVELPLKGWVCLQVPTVNLVTKQAVEYLLCRALSTAFNTGATDGTREVEVARRDLIPD